MEHGRLAASRQHRFHRITRPERGSPRSRLELNGIHPGLARTLAANHQIGHPLRNQVLHHKGELVPLPVPGHLHGFTLGVRPRKSQILTGGSRRVRVPPIQRPGPEAQLQPGRWNLAPDIGRERIDLAAPDRDHRGGQVARKCISSPVQSDPGRMVALHRLGRHSSGGPIPGLLVGGGQVDGEGVEDVSPVAGLAGLFAQGQLEAGVGQQIPGLDGRLRRIGGAIRARDATGRQTGHQAGQPHHCYCSPSQLHSGSPCSARSTGNIHFSGPLPKSFHNGVHPLLRSIPGGKPCSWARTNCKAPAATAASGSSS